MHSKTPLTWPKKGSSAFSPGAREVSACRHTIKKLQNRLADVQRELEDSRKENRILNRLRIRHERDLSRYQAQEGELPQLLTRHDEEVCWKGVHTLICFDTVAVILIIATNCGSTLVELVL